MNIEILNKSSIREDTININAKPEKILLISDYTLVDPINISSPSDLDLYPFITGNGSDLDPYIIENIEIQGKGVKTMEVGPRTQLNYSDFGILINSGGQFIIRNCKISSVSIGIYLSIGISAGPTNVIEGVEINDASLGIFAYWPHIRINISRCNISNCNWVTIKAPYYLNYPLFYGGYGIWLRGSGVSRIESCRIQNCSIGLVATSGVDLISTQLINCGLSFDFPHGIPTYRVNNTVNGKPIGLFYGEDNLTISGQDVSQYGQLIFLLCHNLHLSNVHITDPCSVGLTIYNCKYSVLQNIVCENQQIGFFFFGDYFTADNLYARNCVAGFCFNRIIYSTFTRLLTDNTDIPVYAFTPILNASIGIAKSTRFYLIDFYGYSELQINSSVSSINVTRSFLPEFDIDCFLIHLNDTGIYHVSDLNPALYDIDFTLVIFQSSQTSAIPGFPLFWLYLAILLGILSWKISFRWNKK